MVETIDLVTRAEFARQLGVSRKTVTKYVQTGRIALVKRGGKDFVDPVAARLALKGTMQRAEEVADLLDAREAKAPAEPSPTLTQHKTETERHRAALLKLQLEERAGQLIARDQVEREQETAARMVRKAMDSIPSHSEDIFAAGQKGGVAGVRKALKELIRSTQASMSRALMSAAEDAERDAAMDEHAST